MAITNTQKENAISVLQELNLDRMTEITLINILETKINNNNQPIQEMVDDLCDYLEQNNLGNSTMSAGNNLFIDKQTIIIARSKLIKALSN